MPKSQFLLDARPSGSPLVGTIDLSKINQETLPTILQRICDEIQALKTAFKEICDEIQALKTAFKEAEKQRKSDDDKILAAIQDAKVCNEKSISDYSNDAENLKTFMKVCKFGIAHPWLSVMLFIVTFAAIDYLMRYSYWGIWPK